jgi:hypothetical protein
MSDARFARRRHATGGRIRTRALVFAPVLAAALGGAVAASQPADAATTWEGLRQCESGGNYQASTGNGFEGAYQFSLPTWRSLGYAGRPSQAAPAVQDEAAMKLAKRSGFGQWPVCGRGMGADDLAAPVQASRSTTRVVLPVSAGSFSSRPNFTTALVGQVRDDVRSWQAQMSKLGYAIVADGRYGPASANVARAFQAAKGLTVDGVVGPQTWAASFGG